ncbi:ferritin-like domain-containing protein [Pseudotamlana agarivorans]|uniref:ferritin-like domain-containing protein n=1 Tax=Pseudotamlana agarivorans TaxID=481183 RepID=UPI00082A01BB|nr:PA2169 family four-helix-bundle protein [Tamlana agarivorans]
MSTYTEKVSDKLNDLLEKTYDAEKGFKTAAENVENPALKNYFTKKSDERYSFGHALKTEIKSYGGDVDKGGSVTGTAHRVWMDIKDFLSLDSEEAMLEEAIRGERAAVEEYQEALNDMSIPSSTKSLLLNQKKQIENDLSNIKTLEDLR